VKAPTQTRLYQDGKVLAEGFGIGEAGERLAAHPDAVLWLDLADPDLDDLTEIAGEFRLHPLALEDAVQDHERPKLDRYPDHLFLNVYAVEIPTEGDRHRYHKSEISAFVTERALITVRKSPGGTTRFVERWDADAKLVAIGGVAFLLHGLLDVVVDGHFEATQKLDVAMDAVEDALLEEGGAPRVIRMKGIHLRKVVAALRRAVNPMPEIVGRVMRTEDGLVDEHLQPYFRDVEDHAEHTVDQVEHLRDRIEGMLQADLTEQSNTLNDITRKLAAWAAIIAVPTAVTGYFGQNLPYPGYQTFWGFLLSTGVILLGAVGLYVFLRRRGWL
jgi:magnesium transporter